MSMEWRGGNHVVPPDYRDDPPKMEWDTCWKCGGSGYYTGNGFDEYCPQCNDPPGPHGAGLVLYRNDEPRPWESR